MDDVWQRLRQRNRTQYNLDVATEQAKQKQAFKQKYGWRLSWLYSYERYYDSLSNFSIVEGN